MAIVVAEKIIEMFFIMLCGIVLFKTGLIDDKTVPKLSNILLMLVSPLMIFQSYQTLNFRRGSRCPKIAFFAE